jgi:hypothetical protein
MTVTFSRVNYKGPTERPNWCDFAICRRVSGATVLLEDCPGNPVSIGGHHVEGLATMLWQRELYDLDAGEIRWFQLRDKDLSEIRFGLVPCGRGGFFAMPRWDPASVG